MASVKEVNVNGYISKSEYMRCLEVERTLRANELVANNIVSKDFTIDTVISTGLNTDDLSVTNSATIEDLSVSGDVVTGTLTVTNESILGPTTINTLNVNNTSNFNTINTTAINNSGQLATDTIIVDTSATIVGTLGVTGTTTTNGLINTGTLNTGSISTGEINNTGNLNTLALTVAGNTNVVGNLDVGGITTTSGISNDGDLTTTTFNATGQSNQQNVTMTGEFRRSTSSVTQTPLATSVTINAQQGTIITDAIDMNINNPFILKVNNGFVDTDSVIFLTIQNTSRVGGWIGQNARTLTVHAHNITSGSFDLIMVNPSTIRAEHPSITVGFMIINSI